MAELDTAIEERLVRVLTFLAVSGGAALLDLRRACIVPSVGDIDLPTAIAARHVLVTAIDPVVSMGNHALVADVTPQHRLLVHVPAGFPDRMFAERIGRAVELLQAFVFPAGGGASSPPPAAAAPATVVVAVHKGDPEK